MTNKQPHAIHPFHTDPEAPTMFAVIPDDGTRGYVIGELWEVEQLRDKLSALLDNGQHDGEVSDLHEQLGFKWLTSREAQALIDETGNEHVPISSITHACRAGHIRNAEKAGRDWRFPQMSFLHWYRNRPKPGPKPK